MTLTKDKLKSLYKNKYFIRNSEINMRFSILIELFDEIKNLKKEDLIKNIEPKPSENPFGPAKDYLTRDKAFEGVKAIADKFYEIDDVYHKIIISIGSILGGFDFKNHQMKDEYRIISNSSKSSDDFKASLTSQGQSRHPSSHFADNNYFFNIVEFVNHLDWSEAKMVLRYPNELLKVENDDEDFSMEYQKQKAILESRFPPKFLWMWANKSNVIYPISLMAFRNFLNTEFGKDIINELNQDYTPEIITNMKFDEFKTIWTNISNKILVNLEVEKNHENLENLSKLISKICIEETDIKNISDLLTTGNKAVILWGPPGTGKTYESEQVVKELLEVKVDENFEEKYLFSKGYMNRNEKGYYEIVQFHPNYTYQDFIGGISPKLRGNNVSYELREGIFKKFCDTANKDENKNKKFIFIIDEINRAELSAVFGELLYALEYRGKPINLPHFKSPFTIPSNIYIIGTMNNVDKSLVTFDLALRRRFGFFKLMPKLEVIKDVLSEVIDEESLSKYYDKCEKLNKDIVIKLDLGENYQIGQSYFLKIRDFLEKNENEEIIENQNITSFELEKLWIYNLEPLLEEYLGMSIEDNEVMNKLESLKKRVFKRQIMNTLELKDSQYIDGEESKYCNIYYCNAVDKLNQEIIDMQIDFFSLGGNNKKLNEKFIWYKIDEIENFRKTQIIKKATFFTSHYMGFYSTVINNEIVNIRISPRFGVGIFNYLISFAYGIYFPKGFSNSSSINSDYLWLITLMWKATLEKALTKSQIPKEYQKQSKNLETYKGQLNVAKHLHHNLFDKSKFYCDYRKLTMNTLINQTIRYTYKLLEKKGYANLLKDISEYEQMLQSFGVENQKPTLQMIKNISYSKLNISYKKVMELSGLIIKNESKSSNKSFKNDSFSYFLDIAEVWENYLLKLLEKNLLEYTIYSPNEKGGVSLFTDGSREIRPDIIIEKDNRVVAVLDAKYKHYNKIGKYAGIDKSVSRDDLYQMATYLYYYGNKNENIVGLFISPIEQSEENIKILNNSSNHQIGVVNLNIEQFNSENCGFSMEKVKELEEVFIKKIKGIINATI